MLLKLIKKLCSCIHLRFCSDYAVALPLKPPLYDPFFSSKVPFLNVPNNIKTCILAAATALFDQNWPSRPKGVATFVFLQHLSDGKASFGQKVMWLQRGSIFCENTKMQTWTPMDPNLPPLGSSLAFRWGLLSAQGPYQGPPLEPENQ